MTVFNPAVPDVGGPGAALPAMPVGGRMTRRRCLGALGILIPWLHTPAWAEQLGIDPEAAFNARSPESVYRLLGVAAPLEHAAIRLDAPDVAENGASVPVEVQVDLPGVSRIMLVAERNLFPLLVDADILPATEPWLEAKVKLAETSRLRVIVVAGERWYTASRTVKVIVGGCLPG